jgi:hypothetical protein
MPKIENAMADTEQEIGRLRRRLGWETDGPLAGISNQATNALVPIVSAAINWTRRAGGERPLISILLAAMGRPSCVALICSR